MGGPEAQTSGLVWPQGRRRSGFNEQQLRAGRLGLGPGQSFQKQNIPFRGKVRRPVRGGAVAFLGNATNGPQWTVSPMAWAASQRAGGRLFWSFIALLSMGFLRGREQGEARDSLSGAN